MSTSRQRARCPFGCRRSGTVGLPTGRWGFGVSEVWAGTPASLKSPTEKRVPSDREWFFDHFTVVDAPFFWCFRRGTQFNLEFFELDVQRGNRQRRERRDGVSGIAEGVAVRQAKLARSSR
jgi:hypothetical protein